MREQILKLIEKYELIAQATEASVKEDSREADIMLLGAIGGAFETVINDLKKII